MDLKIKETDSPIFRHLTLQRKSTLTSLWNPPTHAFEALILRDSLQEDIEGKNLGNFNPML